MSALRAALLSALALGLLAAAPAPAPSPASAGKTVILGFDGMDHGLTRRFMDEGHLPNLSRLAEQGTFQRLETSNPAQSPVSWAVFNTGSNPGKTGVGGFVSRYFKRDEATGQPTGNPLPQPMLGFPHEIPADDFVRFPMALDASTTFPLAGAGVFLVAAFLLVKLVLRAKAVVALVLGLAAGAGGWFLALDYQASLPADGMLPYEINPMQGTNFWTHLDEAGVRLMGLQIASTYPPDDEGPHTKLLSGLGVKDIGGSPGSWFVYTDDPWTVGNQTTSTQGKIMKVFFDEGVDGNTAKAKLVGPKNWFKDAWHERRIEALQEQSEHPDTTEAEAQRLAAELEEAEDAYATWKRGGEDNVAEAPFTMTVDRAAKSVSFDVGGERLVLGEGEWSEFVRVEFPFSGRYSAWGVVRFHVLRADDEEVRVFVPPISIDPYAPPEHLPISAPPEFSADVAHGIGHAYETLGWACMTNPLKDFDDSAFTPQAFMDDIVATMTRREEILQWGLDSADQWDVYYQVLSTPDRVAHMLYREYDPLHPLHDAEYAGQSIDAWGRTFPLGHAVPEIYKEVDRIVGGIMDRIEGGDLGDDAMLLIVSDHGFTSFRRGVNLNNLLHELGYLVFKDDKTLDDVMSGPAFMRDLLMYVDWKRTRAYSMGLGKIFINLQGREPNGIVARSEYDELIEGIRTALLGVTDGPDGPPVLESVSRRDELFSGPWWEEGRTTRRIRGQEEEYEHDGFADLFVGYKPYYRVSWGNTMGGLDKSSIVDNTNHWSGGHVSVDPVHVPGVFFSNRPMREPGTSGLIDIGPTMLARYGLDPAATDMDGHVIPLDGVGP